MFFGFLLMLTSLVIAGVSGWFSVYGLAHIYQGAFLSVVLMGGALEVGKLVATSFLYRYWAHTKWGLKMYLMAAILGLMVITSSGIFGYLSNAYQQDAVGIKDVNGRIELINKEYDELSVREAEIDAAINAVDPKYVTARLKLMDQYKPEKTKITERRNVIRAEKLELSSKQLEVEAHTGPIIYIAKAMDKDVDTAVMWLSLLIIAVFDPLAVALTIAANAVFLRHKEQKAVEEPEPQIVEVEKIVEVERVVEVPVEVERVVEVEKIVEVPVEQDILENPLHQAILQTNNKLISAINERNRELKISERERAYQLEEHTRAFEELKTEKDRLVTELQAFLDETKEDVGSRTRLEHSLQNQIDKLNKTIEGADLKLEFALDTVEKRDLRIEELEELNADLEQQVVELRMAIKKNVDMTPTERVALHRQNIADSKNS